MSELKETAASAFDRLADDYDCWFDEASGKIIFENELKAVRVLMSGLTRPFIEIGAGSGRFSEALGIEYGVEPSEKLGEIARRRGIKIIMEQGENLPLQPQSFGAVFILMTLCFVKSPKDVLAEAKKILKPGGRIILGFINSKSLWGESYNQKKLEGHPIFGLADFFDYERIKQLMAISGLKIITTVSTLISPPSENPDEESPQIGFREQAGFICVLAKPMD